MNNTETHCVAEEKHKVAGTISLNTENESEMEVEVEELPAFEIALVQGCGDVT